MRRAAAARDDAEYQALWAESQVHRAGPPCSAAEVMQRLGEEMAEYEAK